jgi:hypothetical protein
MPTVNIPPLVRFILYLAGAAALLFVAYAVDKSWAGDAEVRLVTGVVALLQLLAAAKTNLSDSGDPATTVGKEIADVLNKAGGRAGRRGNRGAVDLGDVLQLALIVLVVVVILVLVGIVKT